MKINNIFKFIIAITIILIIVIGIIVWSKFFDYPKQVACTQEAKLCSDGSYVSRVPPACNFALCPKEDLILVESPRAYEEISSPLAIKGKARGFWFFEASFPIKLLDARGNVVAQNHAQAQGDWMTENFVPFEAELNFPTPSTQKGYLIFEKDNPSGLPKNANELRIPIVFKK